MRSSIRVAMVVLVAACTQQPASDVVQAGSPTDVAAVRAEIDRINLDLERWFAAGHVDSVKMAYAADGWAQGPNSPPVSGRDSIGAMWAGLMNAGKLKLAPRASEVVVLGTTAVERGHYEMSFERAANAPREAPPSFTDRGSYIVLWVKEGDRWLLKWDMGSSSVPLPAPTPAK